MKLRVRNNSIRLRLTQKEVAAFKENGRVEEAIEFGANAENKLVYALESADAEALSAQFANNRITIFVPQKQAAEWVSNDQTGIENTQNIGAEKTLKILIEKDFACATRRDGEDDSDAFPHPQPNENC